MWDIFSVHLGFTKPHQLLNLDRVITCRTKQCLSSIRMLFHGLRRICFQTYLAWSKWILFNINSKCMINLCWFKWWYTAVADLWHSHANEELVTCNVILGEFRSCKVNDMDESEDTCICYAYRNLCETLGTDILCFYQRSFFLSLLMSGYNIIGIDIICLCLQLHNSKWVNTL